MKMKFINIITHPVMVIICFCMMMISGEHFGGFYMVYIMMALPHGGLHAITGIIGAGLLVFSYLKYRRQSRLLPEPLLNVLGVFCMYISVVLFFYNSWDYNDSTFEQQVSRLSIWLFALISLSFLIHNIVRFAKAKPGLNTY